MEFAVDAGSLAPSVNEVQALLDQDRVRQALARAELLAAQYRGPQTDLVYAWALWRNGDVRAAEPRFRRAAEAGISDGLTGLAAVRASEPNWPSVVELASRPATGAAHALLASAAWANGDRAVAENELRAWNLAEAGTARGRAAAAMAAAVSRLSGRPVEWRGSPVLLPLHDLADGSTGLEVRVAGRSSMWRLDLTFRQTIISEELAVAAGIAVDGSSTASARTASERWPSMLSSRQAALAEVDFGGVGVRNIVVAVGDLPEGIDGVLGVDLLSTARWSVDIPGSRMMLAPAGAEGADAAARGLGGRVIAWLSARVVREGLGAQMLLFPRVEDSVVAAGLDLRGVSRLDSDILPVAPGSGEAPAGLMLGGWRQEVVWRPASLSGWAIDGGIAPIAVLGANVLGSRSLHWYPGRAQLRVDEQPS